MDPKATFEANKAAITAGAPVYDLVINQETLNPMKLQEECLMKILADNANTEYGRKYHFSEIHSIDDFRRMVPVITYDNISEMMQRMSHGEKDVLVTYPFGHMTYTSGTVGSQKLIPMTNEHTQPFVKYNRLFTDGLMARKLDDTWLGGRAFCTSEGTYDTLDSGITVGSASAVMVKYIGGADKADKVMRTKFTSPIEATAPLPGTDSKYIHARFWLEDEHCTGIVCGFFSLVSFYLNYIADNYELLINDIEKGSVSPTIAMPDETRTSLQAKLSPNPARAARLREIFAHGSDIPFIPLVWPELKYISGAGADGFACFDETISERFGGGDLARIYSGVTSSEGIFSIPFELNNPDALVVPGAGFLEFLPVEADDDFSQMVTMDQLEVGKIYEIVLTNFAGFYRYRMSDAVQCTGFLNKTPLVQFMYRVNRTVNLVAEKVTEKTLSITVDNVMKRMGIKLRDFTLYPNTEGALPRYDFLVETANGKQPEVSADDMATALSDELCRNSFGYDYEYNKGHLLDKCAVYYLEAGTNDKFIDLMASLGRTPSQQKPVRIITNDLQKQHFLKFRVSASGMNKSVALGAVVGHQSELTALSDFICDNPEQGGVEAKAADAICNLLAKQGFSIERGIAQLPTAFVATFGKGSPRVGLLAEYDAENGVGHIHGRNLVAAGAVGASLALKDYLEQYPDRGTVVLFGCPDRSHNMGKVLMAKAGLFADIDLALGWQPSELCHVANVTTAAFKDVCYTFSGKKSAVDALFVHRQNALDGAELMNVGAQFLRSQIADFGRIEYAYADAGDDNTSIVNSQATVHYNIKSIKLKDMNWLCSRVDDIARGAALMSATELSSKVLGACSGFAPNSEVCSLLQANLEGQGVIAYSADELAQAKQARESQGASIRSLKAVLSRVENAKEREQLLEALEHEDVFAHIVPLSSVEFPTTAVADAGDVSRICPTGVLNMAAWPIGLAANPACAAALSKSGIAHKGMLQASRVLAATAIDFFENPSKVQMAKIFHQARTNGHEYTSPLAEC